MGNREINAFYEAQRKMAQSWPFNPWQFWSHAWLNWQVVVPAAWNWRF